SGVLRIRQSYLREAGPTRGRRRIGNGSAWEKAFDEDFFEALAREVGLYRATDQGRTATGDRNWEFFRFCVGKQTLFSLTTGVRQCRELPRIKFFSTGREFLVERVRECKVHVVPAQQNMITHREARELDISMAFGDRDQRKVTRAPTDIYDQDHI